MFKHFSTAALAGILAVTVIPATSIAQNNGPSRVKAGGTSDSESPRGLPVPEIDPAKNKGPDRRAVRRSGRFQLDFEKVEIDKLVQTMSDLTGRLFILPDNIRGAKISIIGPEHGKQGVTVDEAYAAFLAALDAANLSLYETGRYSKIIEKPKAKQSALRIVTDGERYTYNEQMITRMVRLKHVEPDSIKGILSGFITRDGDMQTFNDLLIITDLGNNMHRLDRIITQLDQPTQHDQMKVISVENATASELAEKLKQLFESGKNNGAKNNNKQAAPPRPRRRGPNQSQNAATAQDSEDSAGSLSQIIADDRTNKLIVIGDAKAFERIEALMSHLDSPVSDDGQVRVYYLANANAEELASTLSSIIQGTGGSSKGSKGPKKAVAGSGGSGQGAESFTGEVKITADKGTNSLVILANNNDYRTLVKVIERLDIARRQVFVEAVIMEVNLEDNTDFGMSVHGGDLFDIKSKESAAVMGSQIGNASSLGGILSLASLNGFLAGLQGPSIEAFGVTIPSFAVVLQALQKSTDVNVLSTPHILTSDNEEAEISVGQNVPFQSGYSSSLSSLASSSSSLSNLSSLLGSYGTIQRTNVELKLKIKPQINESDFIRLEIDESTEEIASQDATLGPTTSKRAAKTTIVARDQQSVVIGGLIQDRTVNSVEKIPLLGDIPVLGRLFRTTSKKKQKTNLLLFLTPYIVRDPADFRRIFDRKMKERQAFVEQFYGRQPGYEVPIDYTRKTGPVARMIQIRQNEQNRLENGGKGNGDEKLITPSKGSSSKKSGDDAAEQSSSNSDGGVESSSGESEEGEQKDAARSEPPPLFDRPPEGSYTHEVTETVS